MEKKPFWNGPRKPATGGPAPRPQGGRNKFRGNQKKDKDEHAINDQIRAQEVRLVGDNVEEGIYPIAKAIQIADIYKVNGWGRVPNWLMNKATKNWKKGYIQNQPAYH